MAHPWPDTFPALGGGENITRTGGGGRRREEEEEEEEEEGGGAHLKHRYIIMANCSGVVVDSEPTLCAGVGACSG